MNVMAQQGLGWIDPETGKVNNTSYAYQSVNSREAQAAGQPGWYYGGSEQGLYERRKLANDQMLHGRRGVLQGNQLAQQGLGQAQAIGQTGQGLMQQGQQVNTVGTNALGNVAQGANRWGDDYGNAQLAQARARDTAMQAGIAYGQQYQQDRAAQTSALGQMGRAAAGQGPSQAEALMQANAAANQRAQMAQAAGMRGGNALAGMRSAQATGAQTAMATGDQAAALRAQEMATARGQFAAQANAMAGASQGGEQWGVNQGGAMSMGMGQQSLSLGGLQANAGANLGSLGNQTTAMGLGARQFGAGATIDQGRYLADQGTAREGTYLNYLSNVDQAQANLNLGTPTNAELAYRDRQERLGFLGGLANTGGQIISAMI